MSTCRSAKKKHDRSEANGIKAIVLIWRREWDSNPLVNAIKPLMIKGFLRMRYSFITVFQKTIHMRNPLFLSFPYLPVCKFFAWFGDQTSRRLS